MLEAYKLNHGAQIRNLKQISLDVDPNYGLVWLYLKPTPRPCFNPDLVEEVRAVQRILESNNGQIPWKGSMVKINYFVLDSSLENIFSMGGDLSLFRQFITNKDKEGFLKYIKVCIETIHGFHVGCRFPIITIACVRGDAMGGGFEVALSCQVLIAEKNIEMGFPEVLFNLFPGMGGYHFLSQRIPVKQVERMMLNGKKYKTNELYDMGVIDKLADEGCGREAVYSYIKEATKYRNSFHALKNVREKVHPIIHDELLEVCKHFVDVAMNISERDLKLMNRLVKAQDRMMNRKVLPEMKTKLAS